MTSDLALASAGELVALFRAKKASPVEATKAALDRIEKHDPALNVFREFHGGHALDQARASEARWAKGEPTGLVDGVTVTVKDLLLTKGWPTLRGSRTSSTEGPWDDDAPSVARLREHGAVILGKTNTPEYGWKGVTDSPLTGITRNPWNPERTPGGSSGGAAAACAMGMGTLHLGTDGGGSIRIPAAFTGIFGIKATFGRVPAWPHSPHGSLANVGPMTRSVGDAALMLSVISEPDPRDWFALPPEGRDYRDGLEDGIEGLKIAFSPSMGGAKVAPEVADSVAAAAKVFEDLGATVEVADPPVEGARQIFIRHWFATCGALMRSFTPAQQKLLDPGLVAIAEIGTKMTLADHLEAIEGRRALGMAMQAFLTKYDLLLTPALPLPAFEVGRSTPADGSVEGWVDWTPFTYPFNLSRQPAASVPCGLTKDGMPIGIQIVGPLYQAMRVLRAARAFEAARPWPLPPAATD